MSDCKIFDVYELTAESSFSSYGNPKMVIGEEEVYDALCECNDAVIVMSLKLKEKFVDSEDYLWIRIK